MPFNWNITGEPRSKQFSDYWDRTHLESVRLYKLGDWEGALALATELREGNELLATTVMKYLNMTKEDCLKYKELKDAPIKW